MQNPHEFAPGAGRSSGARPPWLRLVVWLVGALGFVGLLAASRYLPHPNAWGGAAIVWLLAAGAANTYYILRRP